MTNVTIKNGVFCGKEMNGEFILVKDWQSNTKPQGGHVTVKHGTQTIRINVAQENVMEAVSTESYEDILARINKRFNIMERMTSGVINGTIKSLIIAGASGVGKTYGTERMLKAAEADGMIRFDHIKGRMSAIGLFKKLFENSDKGAVVVIDDCDDIFADDTAMNVLKGALDSSEERWISWNTDSLSLEKEGIPQKFRFDGTVIFITNLNFQSIIDAGKAMAPHMEALISRSVYLDLALHDRKAVMARVEDLAFNTPMLYSKGLSKGEVKLAIDWLKENSANLRTLCCRTALKLAQFVATDEDWMDIAEVTLLRPKS